MTHTVDQELDACGLHCPLPLLKTKKALHDLEPGQILRVTATDPGSWRDFHTWIEQTNHELLDAQELAAGHYRYVLRRA